MSGLGSRVGSKGQILGRISSSNFGSTVGVLSWFRCRSWVPIRMLGLESGVGVRSGVGCQGQIPDHSSGPCRGLDVRVGFRMGYHGWFSDQKLFS